MSFFLVLTPVSDLAVGDWIMDSHGGRRIRVIKRDIDRSYIVFDEGPAGWFLDVETLPTERMA